MMSGRQTLASIDTTLQQLRGQIAENEERIAGYATQKLKLQQEEIEQFRELGRLRLEVLTGDLTVPSAFETDRTVKELLARRKESLSRLQNDVKALEQRRLDLDKRREQQSALVEDAARAIDEAEKKTQERLQQEPEYQRQLQAVQDLERTLQHAQSKASRWEEELETKGSS